MASSLREFGGAYKDEERKPLNSSLQTSVFSPSSFSSSSSSTSLSLWFPLIGAAAKD